MQLTLNPNQLVIQLEWYEQLWAFTLHNPITIPLNHLLRATTQEPPTHWTDLRAPGTSLPGVIRAGTYYTRRGKEFWYVTANQGFLTLELCDIKSGNTTTEWIQEKSFLPSSLPRSCELRRSSLPHFPISPHSFHR
jgi:hypothetical protein